MADGFVPCVVPFCEGGFRGDPQEHTQALCAEHWRLVDKRLKASRTRRLKELEGAGDEWRVTASRYWGRMCQQAIERAAGIA